MKAPPMEASTTQLVQSRVYHLYYRNNDFVLSLEGILKVLSTVVCVVSSVLYADSLEACGARQQRGARGAAGAAALAGAALNAALFAAAGLDLPLYAPRIWLYVDIILTTLMGALLLTMALLIVTVCEMSHIISYLHLPLGLLTAGMMMSSAVITYKSVMRLRNELQPRLGTLDASPHELYI